MSTTTQLQLLQNIVELEKGKPPIETPYIGPEAERYLTPDFLRSRDTTEPNHALHGPNAVRVLDGETIILWDGSNAGEVLRARDGMLASTMMRVNPNSEFDTGYFYYALKFWENYLKSQTAGSGIPHVDREIVGSLSILKIKKTEQVKIAEILSTVDEAINRTELMIAKQQRIKTGLKLKLLTSGVDEDGYFRTEDTHEFKNSPLGRIPVEWKVCHLSELADVRVSNVDKKIDRVEKSIKLCNYMDVYPNEYVTASIDFMAATASKSEISRFGIQAGDVIITKDSETPDDIGVSSVVTETIDSLVCGYHLALIRLRNADVDPTYLAKQISSAPVSRYYTMNANGSTRFGISVGTIEDTWILVAPNLEQIKITEIFSTVDAMIENSESLIAKLQQVKTGLMQDLLTGRVRVTHL